MLYSPGLVLLTSYSCQLASFHVVSFSDKITHSSSNNFPKMINTHYLHAVHLKTNSSYLDLSPFGLNFNASNMCEMVDSCLLMAVGAKPLQLHVHMAFAGLMSRWFKKRL